MTASITPPRPGGPRPPAACGPSSPDASITPPLGGDLSIHDRFELLGELGAGGMGVVYRARDRVHDREVALKVVKAPSGLDLFRFKREFRALADLHHPGLVQLHELLTVGDQWMFTMELISGVPFHTWVRPAGALGPLDEAHLRDALAQVADGLAAIHAAGLVHRDVKPTNIIVEPGGRAVLLDFGLIAGVDELATLPADDQGMGTPSYAAPEQLAGQPLTGASDLYSLGTMLYRALTGRRPFVGARAELLVHKLASDPLLPSRLAAVPADLEALCMRLLARDPAARPDALGVLAALGREPSPATRAILARATATPGRPGAPELEVLEEALADSRDHFVLVTVFGAAGAGKSALLDGFRAELVGTEALVLWGRAAAREALPYRVTDHIVDQLSSWLLGLDDDAAARLLPDDLGALIRTFPVLLRVPAVQRAAEEHSDIRDDRELPRRAGVALLDLLRAVAATRPLVILADDTQWSPASGAALMSMCDGPEAPRCVLVLAHRREVTDSPTLAALAQWRGDLRQIDL